MEKDKILAAELMAIRRYLGIICPVAVKVDNLEIDEFTARRILLEAAMRLDPNSIQQVMQ